MLPAGSWQLNYVRPSHYDTSKNMDRESLNVPFSSCEGRSSMHQREDSVNVCVVLKTTIRKSISRLVHMSLRSFSVQWIRHDARSS